MRLRDVKRENVLKVQTSVLLRLCTAEPNASERAVSVTSSDEQ